MKIVLIVTDDVVDDDDDNRNNVDVDYHDDPDRVNDVGDDVVDDDDNSYNNGNNDDYGAGRDDVIDGGDGNNEYDGTTLVNSASVKSPRLLLSNRRYPQGL